MSKQPKTNEKEGLKNKKGKIENVSILYSRLEKGGLDYVKKQKNYLTFSAIFPIYTIIIQIINLIFIFQLEVMKPPVGPNPGGPDLFDIISPILIFLVISLFTIIICAFLIKWRCLLNRYEKQSNDLREESSMQEDGDYSIGNVSLTQLFYDIIRNMEKIRIIFVILVFFFIFNSIWFIRFFFVRLEQIAPIHPPPIQQHFTVILNFISQISLILYLLFQWRHFHQWNKKLKELKTFEKKIFEELDL